jgi:hypothetical protein
MRDRTPVGGGRHGPEAAPQRSVRIAVDPIECTSSPYLLRDGDVLFAVVGYIARPT